jgi:hypothetical protein
VDSRVICPAVQCPKDRPPAVKGCLAACSRAPKVAEAACQ